MQTAISLMDPPALLNGNEDEKCESLRDLLASLESVIVAYSGGVDSSLLMKVAHDTLGERALAVTAVSPSIAQKELDAAKALAQEVGAQHLVVHTREMENPNYVANSSQRCYFCKSELFDRLSALAIERGIAWVVDGYNADDVGDFRPGERAAQERNVRSPLREVGMTKADIRALSQRLGLPTWHKPALACLASRIPYGTPVTVEALHQVEEAEAFLHSLDLQQVRVRHHAPIARIEVEPHDIERVLAHRQEIAARLQAIGYPYVTLDLAGFRSGSLNETLR